MEAKRNSIISAMEEHFVPIAARIGSQRHLVAIRDGFVATTPVVLAGCLAVLLNNLPLSFKQVAQDGTITRMPWSEWSAANMPWLRTLNGNIWWGTLAMLALFICFTVPYNLVKSRGQNGITGALAAVAAYIAVTPQVVGETWGGIPFGYTSAAGLFGVLLISMLAAELYCALCKTKALIIKMPEGVPPAVGRSFAALFPTMITVFAIAIVCQIFNGVTSMTVFEAINKFVSAPLTKVADTFGTMLGVIFFNQLLWVFGLHGSNVIGALIEPVMMPMLMKNLELVNAGQQAIHTVVKPFFDAYVWMGGSGSTLSLIFAIFIASFIKSKRDPINAHYIGMAVMSVGPGFFNINEPIMFGLPIVLNPIFIIPFIVGPLIQGSIAYVATAINLVPKIYVAAPWTTPPILLAYIATGGSIAAAILAAFNMIVGVIVYLPFVFLGDKTVKTEAKISAEK